MLGPVTVDDPHLLRMAVECPDGAAGYHNRNVRVETSQGPVNVRLPIDGADLMDLRLWPEEDVLAALGSAVPEAPRLLHAGRAPRYLVQEFLDGVVLNDLCPRGVPVPEHVPADVVRLLGRLAAIPASRLPTLPAGWPTGNDTAGFGRRLAATTARLHRVYREEFAGPFAAFGVPQDPLAVVGGAWAGLTRRPLGCVHADLHRKNIIVRDGACHVLDWELALYGDPVYDLAVHLHKMSYSPTERDRLLRLWCDTLSPAHTAGWAADLDVYLAHEQIKAAVVGTVRCGRSCADPSYSTDPPAVLAGKLAGALNDAYRRWGLDRCSDAGTVEATLREWVRRR